MIQKVDADSAGIYGTGANKRIIFSRYIHTEIRKKNLALQKSIVLTTRNPEAWIHTHNFSEKADTFH